MKRKIALFSAFLGLMAGPASAQTVKDVRSVLEASLKAMGGVNLKTIRYSANGWSSRIGQTYGLAEDWPHYEVADYTRCHRLRRSSGRARTTREGRASIRFSAGRRCPRSASPPFSAAITPGICRVTCAVTILYPPPACILMASPMPTCGCWNSRSRRTDF